MLHVMLSGVPFGEEVIQQRDLRRSRRPPLIAIQSLLSMLLRSFVVPVAVCFFGCVAAVTSTALRPLSYVLPQAINTRALNLGSTAIADSGGLTPSEALPLLVAAVGLAAIVVALTLVAIRLIKLR